MSKDPRQIRCSIFPVVWNTGQFQQRQGNISVYAKELIGKNFTKSIDVDREDVELNWKWLVSHVFSKGDARRARFMSLVNSPSFHEFWVERDKQNGTDEPQDNDGFQRAQRSPTRKETQAHPGVVVMVKDGLETLVPDIEFTSLKDVKYRPIVRGVLEANPTRTVTLPEMQLIWDAIVYKIYRFECGCAKEAKSIESMGIDGYTQAGYNQLVLDVAQGIPPPKPRLIITLPLPQQKRHSNTQVSESSSEGDDMVLEGSSSMRQKYKRRSKRHHRCGPGDSYSFSGYPPLMPNYGSASIAFGQLPPQSYPYTQTTGLVEGSSNASAVLGSTSMASAGGNLVGEDDEDEIGAWSY